MGKVPTLRSIDVKSLNKKHLRTRIQQVCNPSPACNYYQMLILIRRQLSLWI